MRKSPLTLLAVLVSCALMVAAAWAGDVRVQVATVDGAPVYHWRPFKSVLDDDVDRTLVIREFLRKSYELPRKLVDDAVKQQITDQFGGSSDRFKRHLREEGATLADFREFAAEEIIVNAMLNQNGKTPADETRLRAEWLAGLRANAVVKRLPAKGKTAEG